MSRLLIFIAFFHVVYLCFANSWPQFRGLNGLGVAALNEKPPVEFNQTKNVLWKVPIQSGVSSPCIWEDHLFLTEYNKKKNILFATCLARADGEILWQQTIPADSIEKVHTASSPAAATPVTDGTYVYFYFGSFGLLCYDFNGKPIWKKRMPIPKKRYGTSTSPILYEGQLFINCDALENPHILALKYKTGEIQCQTTLQKSKLSASYSTLVVWKQQLILHMRGRVQGFDPVDKTLIWTIPFHTTGVSTPVFHQDQLFVSGWNGFGESDLNPHLPLFQAVLNEYDQNGDVKIAQEEYPQSQFRFIKRSDVENIPGAQNFIRFGMLDRNKDGFIEETEWNRFRDGVENRFQQKKHGLFTVTLNAKDSIDANSIQWCVHEGVPEVPSPLYYKGLVYTVKNGSIVTCVNAETVILCFWGCVFGKKWFHC